jgi:hypothetical protein
MGRPNSQKDPWTFEEKPTDRKFNPITFDPIGQGK